MPGRAVLDSNVFIFGFERPRSNSHEIVERLVRGEFQGVVPDRILREVIGYFRRHYGKDLAAKFRDLILLTCDLVLEGDLRIDRRLTGLVGRKDAGALAAARSLGLSHLVSTDSDFSKAPEWRTPKAFVGELGGRPRPGEA